MSFAIEIYFQTILNHLQKVILLVLIEIQCLTHLFSQLSRSPLVNFTYNIINSILKYTISYRKILHSKLSKLFYCAKYI